MIYGNKFIDDESIMFIIGESNMSGEAETEFKAKNRIYEVWVYEKEGPIPHFHLMREGFECYIMLKYPEYFYHGSKTDTLKSKECKALNEWLNERPYGGQLNNWERLVEEWNRNQLSNSKAIIPVATKQPNYSTIYPYKTFTK